MKISAKDADQNSGQKDQGKKAFQSQDERMIPAADLDALSLNLLDVAKLFQGGVSGFFHSRLCLQKLLRQQVKMEIQLGSDVSLNPIITME